MKDLFTRLAVRAWVSVLMLVVATLFSLSVYGFDINVKWDTVQCPEAGNAAAKLGSDGEYLYYFPGNFNSTNFWRYDPDDGPTGTWEQLASFYAHPNQRDGIGLSRGLDYHDGAFYTIFRAPVWDDGFWLYRYDISQDEWEYMTNNLLGAMNGTWAESPTKIHANWASGSDPIVHITWPDGPVTREPFNCQNCAADSNWTHDFDPHPSEFDNYVYGVKNDWTSGTMAGPGDVLWRCLKTAYTSGSPIALAQLPWNPGAGVSCVSIPAPRSFSGSNEVMVVRGAGINANQDGWGTPTPDVAVYSLSESRWLTVSELPTGADRCTDATEINGVLFVKTGENTSMYIGRRISASKPETPQPAYPPEGTTGLSLIPELISTAYEDTNGLGQAAGRWQVSTNVSFATPVWDTRSSILQQTNATLQPGLLLPGTRYYWRVQHANVSNIWSEWSDSSWFETLATNPIVTIDVDWQEFIGPESSGTAAKLGSDGTYLYYIPGNSSSNFWRFDPAEDPGDAWTQLACTPGNPQNAFGLPNGLDYRDGYLYTILQWTNGMNMFHRYSIEDDRWEFINFSALNFSPTHACWAGPDGRVSFAPWAGGGGMMIEGSWDDASINQIVFNVGVGHSPNWLSGCTDTSPAEFDNYVYGIKNDWNYTNVVSSGELLWCVPQDLVSVGNFHAIKQLPWPIGIGCALVGIPGDRSFSSYDEVVVMRGAGGGGANQDGYYGEPADDIAAYIPALNVWVPMTPMPYVVGIGSDITELNGTLYIKEGDTEFFYAGTVVPEPGCLGLLVLAGCMLAKRAGA